MAITDRGAAPHSIGLVCLLVLAACCRDSREAPLAPDAVADQSADFVTGPTVIPFHADADYRGGCAVAANGTGSIALELNETYDIQSVIWTGGTLERAPGRFIEVIGLNRSRQLTGYAYGAAYGYPLYWSSGTGVVPIQTGGSPSEMEWSRPAGINNGGEVALSVYRFPDPNRAWSPTLFAAVWNSSTDFLRLLPSPPVSGKDQSNCTVAAINDAGWVGGRCGRRADFSDFRPYRWISGRPIPIPMPDHDLYLDFRIARMNRWGAVAGPVGNVAAYWSAETGWIEIPMAAGTQSPTVKSLTGDGNVLLDFGYRAAVWSRAAGTTRLLPLRAGFRMTVNDMTDDGLVVGCFWGPDSPPGGAPATWRVRF